MWLLPAAVSIAAAPTLEQWTNAGDTASVRVREAATRLSETASGIARAGRIGNLAPLHADAEELVRRAEILEKLLAAEPRAE
jgi:hypothetical protein